MVGLRGEKVLEMWRGEWGRKAVLGERRVHCRDGGGYLEMSGGGLEHNT